jgi:hypothetical protein
MPTVVVTNMPFWAERAGVPRTLGIEFPFGHLLGRRHDAALQMRVIAQALDLLETAREPGTIVHSPEMWPGTQEEAMHLSHSDAPPPVTREMGRHIGKFLQGLRRDARAKRKK